MCYTIEEIKNKTVPIAKKHGLQKVSLFGSYARGEADDYSDVDIYVDKGQMRSLLRYYAFIEEMEAAFKCHVDVITTGIEDKDFLNKIMKEGIVLYEQ